ncbi:MAG: nucleotidyltransferase family protein [Chloroflexota bacterium]
MYAIVTAGGIPQPEDPLYIYSKGDSKALIDLAGKPMIQWVLDALNDAREVDAIIVIGLSAKTGLKSRKPIHYLSNQGRMLANIVAGVNKALELDKKTEYVLVASSDIPTLRGDMVDWLVNTCMETDDELYYGVCPREVMEERFPDSRRTYTRLKDMELCGADIHVTHVRMATEHLDLWERLIGNRKSPFTQASIVGLGLVWKVFVTHSLTLDGAVEEISRRIGIKGRAIVWDHAEPCMDVDKPHQLELLRADLEARVSKEKAAQKRAAKKAALLAPKKILKDSASKSRNIPAKGKVVAKAKASSGKPAARKKMK